MPAADAHAHASSQSLFLSSNFSAAAAMLHEQHIYARLAKVRSAAAPLLIMTTHKCTTPSTPSTHEWQMEIRKDWPESLHIAQRLHLSALPDIKIFRNGRGADYQAGAGAAEE